MHLGDACLFDHAAVPVQRLHGGVGGKRARLNTPGQNPAEIGVAFQRRHQHAERAVGVDIGAGDTVHDLVEQAGHVVAAHVRILGRPALLSGRKQDGKIKLFLVGVEHCEQVEDLVMDGGGPGVGLVDLVDDDDGLEAQRQRLAGDELGLRHRAFRRIDQQDDAVDHREDALHFAAEVGVAGRVDDVDARAVPFD